MSAAVFFAILFAAALHAGWNALVKLGLNRFSSILFLALVQGAIAPTWISRPGPHSERITRAPRASKPA